MKRLFVDSKLIRQHLRAHFNLEGVRIKSIKEDDGTGLVLVQGFEAGISLPSNLRQRTIVVLEEESSSDPRSSQFVSVCSWATLVRAIVMN